MSIALLRTVLITDPMVVLLTVVMGSISLVASLADSTGRSQHAIARAWARMLLFVFRVKATVTGIGKLRPDSSYVFAANHLSYVDTPLILAHIPEQFRFLAKASLFSIPFLGHHLKRAGHISVPRENVRASLRTMTDAASIVREKNVSILVFPEGGRSDGVLEEFKEGAAYIAIKSGAPIVPLAIEGTRAIMTPHVWTIRGGPVRLTVGDPISTSGLSLKDRERLTASVRDQIAGMLGVQEKVTAAGIGGRVD